MKYQILTLDDFEVAGRTVLCRIDINQPVDKAAGRLKDTTRIRACLPTVSELADRGAKLVLLAHQGSDVEYQNYYTTRLHASYLEEYLGRDVMFIDDVVGPAAREAIARLKPGQILLLDNVRFVAEEQTLFETRLNLTMEQMASTLCVEKLAPLADLYVCDAFAAAHRAQPTLCGFEMVLPSCMGRLFEREYGVVSGIMEAPDRPCVFILGGAKVQDAFSMMERVLSTGSADTVLCGGLVGNIMLAAQGHEIGAASMDFLRDKGLAQYIDEGRRVLMSYSGRIVLPVDLACVVEGERREVGVDSLQDAESYVDIGELTVARFAEFIQAAATVFVNGPMGVFEAAPSAYGTREVWRHVAGSQAFSVVGGGDSISAAHAFAVIDDLDYVCTGGGALLRFLSGEQLPVVQALRHAEAAIGVPEALARRT
ncbi:phosphoglycerate kinase [Tessaracoccus sp. Z1128]